MTVDEEEEHIVEAKPESHLLFLGSSVVERGVSEHYLDSLFRVKRIALYSTNSGTGGFFAKANLILFRTMLEQGLRPSRVVYGVFLQELNGRSTVHANVSDEDTSSIRLKKKTLWNALRYGATALSPMLDNGINLHIYLFALNNAFREIRNPNFVQRLSFGENVFERDSNYSLRPDFLGDLEQIHKLCKARNIPFAFFNTPVRPKVESLTDLPYLHRLEAYQAVESYATQEKIPIWNFDKPGFFDNEDFQDTYHLTTEGARKMTRMLSDKIEIWEKGFIEQDLTRPSPNNVGSEVQDSLVRSVFHF